jgi:hypothetical protein
VVCLLVNGLADAPQVASATLLDLAARRVVEIHEVGAGAENTLVRLGRGTLPESAPAYERRIVERVAATAGRTFAGGRARADVRGRRLQLAAPPDP